MGIEIQAGFRQRNNPVGHRFELATDIPGAGVEAANLAPAAAVTPGIAVALWSARAPGFGKIIVRRNLRGGPPLYIPWR
jgi:hypothetical protein